ncbi:MAG TPA: GFA family protein [Methyloceanibacter sp.]|nr:GFA family protein [Methyloceanibacter sp.]
MSSQKIYCGRCLCGAVRFTAAPEKAEMAICHCGMCRRWAGGVFMAVDCSQKFEIEDDRHLGLYQSSPWGERGFCKICGSTLFWRARDGSSIHVSAQAFDDPEAFELTQEIFIDEKPANFALANATQKLTGAEVMAMWAPKQG